MQTPPPQQYLHPDFDPHKLTINQLCSILSFHYVDLPGTKQKKDVYVNLFRMEIQPRAKDLLREIESVKASSKGIEIVSLKSKIPVIATPIRPSRLEMKLMEMDKKKGNSCKRSDVFY